jgi:ATP-dependent RNA helicase RhlE
MCALNTRKNNNLKFSDLGLDRPLLNALDALGHDVPTPIQVKAIPTILDGRDVIGLAQTGTGKTGAFALPLLQRLAAIGGRPKPHTCRALILAPTRELVTQIMKAVRDYGSRMKLSSTAIVGGVSIRPQKATMARGVDVVVATPGRLLDLIDQRAMRLDCVEVLILDEADQMLDIGFMPAIRRVVSMVPEKRQTLLFSATMPKEIRKLTNEHLKSPLEIAVAAVSTPAERINQSVIHIPAGSKIAAVAHLARENMGKRVIVFTRTKRGADRVVKRLALDGFEAAAIHGNKSQSNREKALDRFRKGSCPILVATDIAARGIDVPGVEMVINYELPHVPEVYVHRIGRTARAGASGFAVALCAHDERGLLRDIERLLKRKVDELPVPEGMPEISLRDIPREPRQRDPRAKTQHKKRSHQSRRPGGGAAKRAGSGGVQEKKSSPGPNRRRRPNRSKPGGQQKSRAA